MRSGASAKRFCWLASGAAAHQTWSSHRANDKGDVDRDDQLPDRFHRSDRPSISTTPSLFSFATPTSTFATAFRSGSVVSCEAAFHFANHDDHDEDEEHRFRASLSHHRSMLRSYKEKWDYVENRSSRVPTISWPSHRPGGGGELPFDENVPLSSLRSETVYCDRNRALSRSNLDQRARDADDYCVAVSFQSAYLVLVRGARFGDGDDDGGRRENSTVEWAFSVLKGLAEDGHADSMCLYAQLLNNGVNYGNKNKNKNKKKNNNNKAEEEVVGFSLEPNPRAAVAWLHRLLAARPDHSQGLYELGVAYYTGEGVVEDERTAVEHFRRAARSPRNAAAAYMLGDCLLDGVGARRDRAAALDWLVRAGERGHRGARSRVLAVLEHEEDADYGDFTDASRQTLRRTTDAPPTTDLDDDDGPHIDDDVPEDDDEDDERRHWEDARVSVILNERKYTMGGVPSVKSMIRRRTTVDASRDANDATTGRRA